MSAPDIIRPGAKIAREYLNALRETARRGNIQVAGQGLSSADTPGGMVVSLNPAAESRENCLRMEYLGLVTGEVLLPGSVVHILNTSGASGILQFDLADYSGRQRLGVLVEGAAPDDCPWVQYQGLATALVDKSTWPGGGAAFVSGQMGARAGSPFAQYDPHGPLYADGASFAADEALGLPANIQEAVVFIESRRRGTMVHCMIPGFLVGDATGNLVNSWVFGDGFEVDEADITPPEGFDPFPVIDGGDIQVWGL